MLGFKNRLYHSQQLYEVVSTLKLGKLMFRKLPNIPMSNCITDRGELAEPDSKI